MKKVFTVILILFFGGVEAQNYPEKITSESLKKIEKEVAFEISKLKIDFEKKGIHKDEIEFKLDTFKINTKALKKMEIDYSTTGINEVIGEMIEEYDMLLNKYYSKLMKRLRPEDKKKLLNAQRAWLQYRDTEQELIGTMTKVEYSGGGTIQSNIEMGAYLKLIKERTIDIFNYYNEIIKE